MGNIRVQLERRNSGGTNDIIFPKTSIDNIQVSVSDSTTLSNVLSGKANTSALVGVQAKVDNLFSILDGRPNDIFVEFDASNTVSNFLQERGVFKENDLIDHVRVVFPNYIPPESSVTCNIYAVDVQTFTNVAMTRNSNNEYGLFLTGLHTAEAAPLVFTVTVDDGISAVVYENFTVMVESTGFNFLQNQLDDKLDKETLLDQTVKGRVFFEKGIEVFGEDSGNKIVLSGDAMSGNFVFSAGTSWD